MKSKRVSRSALVETIGLFVESENATVMVSPFVNPPAPSGSPAIMETISGAGGGPVASPIPPRFVITPFTWPSESPGPPSVIVRTMTLSLTTLRSCVISVQVLPNTSQY